MTQKKVTRKRKPLAEGHSNDQIVRIARLLGEWLNDSAGRSVTLTRTEHGWAARLSDERSSTGTTPIDALAQLSTCIGFDVAINDLNEISASSR